MSSPVKTDRMLVQLSEAELDAIIERAVAAALDKHKSDKLLYSTKEAAQKLGVDESWLAARARAGLVPCRMLGHYRYFSMPDIETIIDISYVPLVQSSHDGKRASTDSEAPRTKPVSTCSGDGDNGD